MAWCLRLALGYPLRTLNVNRVGDNHEPRPLMEGIPAAARHLAGDRAFGNRFGADSGPGHGARQRPGSIPGRQHQAGAAHNRSGTGGCLRHRFGGPAPGRRKGRAHPRFPGRLVRHPRAGVAKEGHRRGVVRPGSSSGHGASGLDPGTWFLANRADFALLVPGRPGLGPPGRRLVPKGPDRSPGRHRLHGHKLAVGLVCEHEHGTVPGQGDAGRYRRYCLQADLLPGRSHTPNNSLSCSLRIGASYCGCRFAKAAGCC